MSSVRIGVVLGFCALVGACDKTPEPAAPSSAPATAPAPVTSGSSASTASASGAPKDIAYDVPKSWEVMPNTNQMRKATIKVPRQDGDTEDAELTVSTAGGGKDANIGRWAGQFGLDKPTSSEERDVSGLKVTVVELKGPYGGMGGGPKKDKYMMLGAVIPGAGDQLHFLKLTGPEKTVTASKKDFDAFVASVRAK